MRVLVFLLPVVALSLVLPWTGSRGLAQTGEVIVTNITPPGATGVSVNGAAASYEGGTRTFAAAVTFPADGAQQVEATATDYAGNTCAVTVDTAAPALTISAPAAGATLAGNSITVTGTVGPGVCTPPSLAVATHGCFM